MRMDNEALKQAGEALGDNKPLDMNEFNAFHYLLQFARQRSEAMSLSRSNGVDDAGPAMTSERKTELLAHAGLGGGVKPATT